MEVRIARPARRTAAALLLLSLAASLPPAARAQKRTADAEKRRAAETAKKRPADDAAGEKRRAAWRVPNELLVKFESGGEAGKTAARRAHARTGATVLREFPALGWQLVRLPAGRTVERALADYAKEPGVESAQPNFVYRLAAAPNDLRYLSGEQYGLAKISAPSAWDSTTGSSAVVVAVIDTGIKYTHEDLQPNVWTNAAETPANGIDDDANGYVDDVHGADTRNNDGDPMDDNGHGTHVAGIVGAAGNNSLGVAGVNWSVRLMGVKMFDAAGVATTATAVAALQYVTQMRLRGVNVRVSNSSWGGPPEAPDEDPALKEAFRAAGEAGIVNVCAAGNNGRDTDAQPLYPASFQVPNIISVAASDANDFHPTFSNYGAESVDLAAPGVSILSTTTSAPGYNFLSGTSMAAPHVAGAAALLAARDPSLSAASIKATLLNTVDPLQVWSLNTVSGGRLNAAGALASPTACTYQISPTSVSRPPAGGGGSFLLDTQDNCDWTAQSSAPDWLIVTSETSGSGDATINFNVEPNEGPPRSATITVGDRTFTVTQAAQATPGQVLISEFRIDGPAGPADEFVELYNNTDQPITPTTMDGSSGWSLVAFVSTNGAPPVAQSVCSVSDEAFIPARGHYLCTNRPAGGGGYSLRDYAGGDVITSGTGVSADGTTRRFYGLALFRTGDPANFTLANRLDSVSTTANTHPLLADNGAGLPYEGEYNTTVQFSWLRRLSSGRPQETDDSAADFVLVSTNGGQLGTAQSTLGAPGPESTTSPVQRNATVKSSLIDPCAAAFNPPNRVRNLTPDPANNSANGTLTFRRKFTNATGQPVTRLRFRVVDITTAPAPPGTADLRARTSADSLVIISMACGGGSVLVRGTTLEQPPAQPNGGGLNSTLAAGTISLATPLAAGASVNVQFLLGVQQTGTFRFFINVEALP